MVFSDSNLATFSEVDSDGKPVPIVLTAGEQRQLPTIQVRRLTATIRVAGQVLMPDGTPAHGVAVRASAIGERDDGYTAEAVHSKTDDAGRFALQLFPNVTYVLSASAVDLSIPPESSPTLIQA